MYWRIWRLSQKKRFFFSSRRRHTRCSRDWSSDVCSSDLNAGFAWFGPSERLAANTLDQLFAANVQAPYLLVSVLAPKMVARGDGVIINIASRAGAVGQPDSAAYGATKAALASFARSWAAEYGPAGIRVNAISPGPVYTGAAKRELFDASGKT